MGCSLAEWRTYAEVFGHQATEGKIESRVGCLPAEWRTREKVRGHLSTPERVRSLADSHFHSEA